MRRLFKPDGYPCDECPEVFGTPGGLGGHKSQHRQQGPRPVPSEPMLPPVTRYCECGGALTLRGESDSALVATIEVLWDLAHEGPGHGPCTPNDATLVRYARSRKG